MARPVCVCMLKLCAFDTETRGSVPQFVCGSIFSDGDVGYYESADSMLEAMRSHARAGYTFIAHNAEYDIATLMWAHGEDVSINYANSTYSTASWRYGAGKRTRPIWDSMRLCAGLSLAELGKSIGIAKLPTPRHLLDADDIRQDWVCDEHTIPGCLRCYVSRDSEIVWSYANALREWLEAYGLQLRSSLARSTIELWRTLDPGQSQTLRDPQVKRLARMAYHGGRNEVFQYGHVGRVYTADIRSFYGSLLRTIRLPDIGNLSFDRNLLVQRLPQDGDGCVEATVSISDQLIPPLPVNYHDRTYYPVGLCRGAWPISELRAALPYGVEIVKIHAMAWTDQMVQPFTTVAGTLLDLRESLRGKGDARELVAKYMLNTIPGRLAMADESERTIYRRWRKGMTVADTKGNELESQGESLYLANRYTLRRPSRYANVLWAACILGAARTRLNQYLRLAGEDALYCDTDSVHSLSPLPVEHDLPGMLRDTGVFDRGIYLGAKFYSLEMYDGRCEARAKGIPRQYAAEFVKSGHVAYQTTLGVVNGILRNVGPCVWVDADRTARFAPGTRSILTPGVLSGAASRSKTAPIVMCMDDTDLQSMSSPSMIEPWKD